jgi:hypothetical protein
VIQVLGRVWMLLHEAGVRAAVMGGIAVSVWRHIRATHDVDLLVALNEDQLAGALGALAKGGFYCRRLPPIIKIDDTRIIQLLHDVPDTYLEIRVDLLLADTEFERQALELAGEFPFEGIDSPVPVIPCEHLIIFKLLAGRILDRADAAYLLRANRMRIDLAQLRRWAQEFKLIDELQETWRQAFPGEELPSVV